MKNRIKNRILFVRNCFLIGAIIDLAAVVPLLFPDAARVMFGLSNFNPSNDYLYTTRIAASLMLGWTVLLFWGSFKPLERRGILLITVFPVLIGLFASSILVVYSGFIDAIYILPLWIIYILLIPIYIFAYFKAGIRVE
jgi:hypothetical protein